ncbi:nitroreductase family protein [Streptomyces althioticus]|uniref:nitroreductase family protein n=1 Tax=Streptomyces althioticus TaxID=83380 RepID=UPI003EBEADF6
MSPHTATTAAAVHPLLADRWSPRSFDATHILDDEELVSLLEAARWAPSAYKPSRGGSSSAGVATPRTCASSTRSSPSTRSGRAPVHC